MKINRVHTTLRVNDNKCDDRSAYGYWNSTDNRLDNWSGCGTVASREKLRITAVRACVNIQFAPDPCGNWG